MKLPESKIDISKIILSKSGNIINEMNNKKETLEIPQEQDEYCFDWPKFASVIGAIVMAIAWVGFFAFVTIAIIK